MMTVLSEIERRKEALAMSEDVSHLKVDRGSLSWQAIRHYIRKDAMLSFQSLLRKRGSEFGETQYARGALDALESLLEWAGEEV